MKKRLLPLAAAVIALSAMMVQPAFATEAAGEAASGLTGNIGVIGVCAIRRTGHSETGEAECEQGVFGLNGDLPFGEANSQRGRVYCLKGVARVDFGRVRRQPAVIECSECHPPAESKAMTN